MLDNSEAIFYTATIILILEYLFEWNIVYRDLKPENMIVDDIGYINLIDFGTATWLSMNKNWTHTIIGTPHYMAPETLKGKGYNCTADLWSLGVIIFELMCGYVPFGENETDPISIYNAIVMAPLVFPDYFTESENEKAI